ncbi:MAG TPA: branched-chain amino acid ABC transporter substrate-binding protein [Geothermobacteraceae bacterium]|nr:branched-chain amino acid ABC transporter substrate-binding protein [Geothermobacteraceae bacterium]
MLRYVQLFLVAGLTLLVASPVLAADAIKIGVAGPHTGDLAPYGIPTKEAAEMYVADVNAAGGVLGKQIELIPLDDQCKADIATNVATKLVSEGVVAVIGHVCSGATKSALGIYQEAKVIVISPSATTPPLTQSGDYPNFFRTIGSDDLQGKYAADFVTKTLGAKKVAVIHDKADYGKGVADFAKKVVEEEGLAKVVLYEGITPGAMDYSAVVLKLRREGADAVIFGGYHPEASKLIANMKKKRVKIPFIGPDGIKGDGFLEIAGKNAEGVYATGPENYDAVAMNKKVRAAYSKQFNKEVGTFFDQGYAAIQVLVAAIKASGGTDYAGLTKALRSNYVDTTVGKIKFDSRGDAEGVGFSVYQVQNGTFVEVK